MATRDDDVIVKPRDKGSPWGWILGLLLLLALIAIGVLLYLWLQEDDSEGADVGVTLSEVSSDPEEFFGETVIVSGEVNEVVAPNAFTFAGGDEFLGGGEEILVVSAEPFPVVEGREDAIIENDLAQVRGTVVEFIIADVEEEFGLDLGDDDALVEFEGQPAIIADAVDVGARVPREEDEAEAGAEGDTGEVVEDEGAAAGEGAVVEPGEITDDLEGFIDQPVTVRGEVAEVLTPTAFRYEDDLLVLGAQEFAGIEEDVEALTNGVVVEFIIVDVEEELGVDLDDEAFEEFEGQPAVIADAVNVVASIDEITGDTEAYVGTTVTVSSEISEVLLDPTAFVLDEGDLLVLSATEPAEAPIAEATAVVTGEVVIFVIADIEEDLGVDLDDETFAEFEDQPAILAEEIAVVR